MSQPPERNRNGPHAPVPLQYATPSGKPPAGNVPTWAQFLLGFLTLVFSIGLGLAVVRFGGLLGTLSTDSILLVALTIVALVRWHWRGFLFGILASLCLISLLIGGLILLVIGLCMNAFR